MTTFNRTDIIRHMARTIEVLAYMSWCDEWDQADDQASRPEDCVSAGPGEDWMNIAPEEDQSDLDDYGVSWYREAAILYGRIWQAWGREPRLVLAANGIERMRDARDWAHYAVMSAIGHGVCWEDDHDALSLPGVGDEEIRFYTVPCFNLDTPEWPGGAYPTEKV